VEIEGEEKLCLWMTEQENKLDLFSKKYMLGSDDGKLFIFSGVDVVQNKIKELFPACELVEVDPDDYLLDYDYRDLDQYEAKRLG